MDRKVPFARIVQHMMPFFVTPPGLHRAPARSAPRTTPSPATTRSPSARTSWRPRSGWRRCTRGPSSTRATSRTPTPRSTAGCTSSWATPTWPRSPPTSRWARWPSCSSMVEDDFIERDLSVDGPVAAFRKVSRDLACRDDVPAQGRPHASRAVDLQREFLALAQRYYRDREHEPWVREVLTRWEYDARPAGRGSDAARPRARLGHQAPAHRELHGQARPGVERLARADDRPPVPRHPARPGPLLQARGVGGGRPHGDRRRDRQGHLRSAQGHPGVLPRACACSATRTRSCRPAGTR